MMLSPVSTSFRVLTFALGLPLALVLKLVVLLNHFTTPSTTLSVMKYSSQARGYEHDSLRLQF